MDKNWLQIFEKQLAAKSLQSCPTLQPHRWQPARLPHPWDSPGENTGVGCYFLLQCIKVKVKVKSLSRVQLFVTPWTAAYQATPSMGFSREEHWSGVPLPSLKNSLSHCYSNLYIRGVIYRVWWWSLLIYYPGYMKLGGYAIYKND